jgi:4-hydroxy-tetrahydrodipicolinate synthase
MFKGSIPALVTPMRANFVLDLEAWDRVLDFHWQAGSDGVVVGGTTGESPVLELDELEELVRRARQRLGGRIPVIAASGTNSTAKSVSMSKRAADAGADALLVVTPYYNRPTQEGLVRHFTAIADAVPIPLILYNVPSRTACDLLPETAVRLSQHPRIAGIKEATGEIGRVGETLRSARAGFCVLSGDDATAAELIKAGGVGVISVTANVVPKEMHELCAAALAGDHERAARIDDRLRPLHESLFVEANPIPVKWCVARLGLIEPAIRLPLTQLATERHAELESAMRAAGISLP